MRAGRAEVEARLGRGSSLGYARPVESTVRFAIIFFLALVGCPSAGNSVEGSSQKPTTTCTRDGQNCEYSPGKIGLCTAKADGCDGSLCFACVSLH
jgi:hypothetical protein